ncbi:MAG: glycerophosphodiester phosphodiesterase family protein [Pseudomonadales bacterium]
MDAIKLVAHRGYQRLFPENTLLSYVEAINAGAQFIETDIQLSADGHPVLYHDRKLKRSSALKGAIHDHSLDQLLHAPNHEPKRFGSAFIGQTINPLSELVTLLKAHPNVHAFIEAKSCSIDFHGIDTVYQSIVDTLKPIARQCTLISFHIPFIAHAKAAGEHSLGIALRRWKDLQRTEVQDIAPEYIFANVGDVPKKADLNDLNAKLVVYEIDSPDIACALQQRGVEYIETFAIGDMHKTLVANSDSNVEKQL